MPQKTIGKAGKKSAGGIVKIISGSGSGYADRCTAKEISDLIYTRILEPCSKRSSYKAASEFLEKPSYELHDVYRALDVLGAECDLIQSEIKEWALNPQGFKRVSDNTLVDITKLPADDKGLYYKEEPYTTKKCISV